MNGQFDLYGIFLPSFSALALLAYVVFRFFASVFAKVGFYRLVWHRSLFNVALYVTALGGLFFAIQWYQR